MKDSSSVNYGGQNIPFCVSSPCSILIKRIPGLCYDPAGLRQITNIFLHV